MWHALDGLIRYIATPTVANHRLFVWCRVGGKGPAFHRFGNRVRYGSPDVDEWAAKRRATTTAEADRLKTA